MLREHLLFHNRSPLTTEGATQTRPGLDHLCFAGGGGLVRTRQERNPVVAKHVDQFLAELSQKPDFVLSRFAKSLRMCVTPLDLLHALSNGMPTPMESNLMRSFALGLVEDKAFSAQERGWMLGAFESKTLSDRPLNIDSEQEGFTLSDALKGRLLPVMIELASVDPVTVARVMKCHFKEQTYNDLNAALRRGFESALASKNPRTQSHNLDLLTGWANLGMSVGGPSPQLEESCLRAALQRKGFSEAVQRGVRYLLDHCSAEAFYRVKQEYLARLVECRDKLEVKRPIIEILDELAAKTK